MLYVLRYRDRGVVDVNIEVDPATDAEADIVGHDYIDMVLGKPNITFVYVKPACVHSSQTRRLRLEAEAEARRRKDADLLEQRERLAAGDGPDTVADDDMAGDGIRDSVVDETDKAAVHSSAEVTGRTAPTVATVADKAAKPNKAVKVPPSRSTGKGAKPAPPVAPPPPNPANNEPTQGDPDPRGSARARIANATRAGRVGQ